jgi:hypothetical protein
LTRRCRGHATAADFVVSHLFSIAAAKRASPAVDSTHPRVPFNGANDMMKSDSGVKGLGEIVHPGLCAVCDVNEPPSDGGNLSWVRFLPVCRKHEKYNKKITYVVKL